MSTQDFLLILTEDRRSLDAVSLRAMSALLGAQRQWVRTLHERHALVAYARLGPVEQGHAVTRRDGALASRSLADEPDAQAIAALVWVRAPSIEAATELARACPLGEGEALSVRSVMHGVSRAELARCRGPIFAAIVRGAAPSLDRWNSLMDHIDRSTAGHIPSSRFVGGVRLRAPLDGPFIESKELVGGALFLRARCASDALDWASRSAFVALGSLEVRALWR